MQHCLKQAKHEDHAPGASLGPYEPFFSDAGEQNRKQARERKPNARKQQLGSRIRRVDPKQRIADLDRGKGTAPKKAA